jgi:hypothetical protein
MLVAPQARAQQPQQPQNAPSNSIPTQQTQRRTYEIVQNGGNGTVNVVGDGNSVTYNVSAPYLTKVMKDVAEQLKQNADSNAKRDHFDEEIKELTSLLSQCGEERTLANERILRKDEELNSAVREKLEIIAALQISVQKMADWNQRLLAQAALDEVALDEARRIQQASVARLTVGFGIDFSTISDRALGIGGAAGGIHGRLDATLIEGNGTRFAVTGAARVLVGADNQLGRTATSVSGDIALGPTLSAGASSSVAIGVAIFAGFAREPNAASPLTGIAGPEVRATFRIDKFGVGCSYRYAPVGFLFRNGLSDLQFGGVYVERRFVVF